MIDARPLLVTGASGQVGGAFAMLARNRGIQVIAPARAELDLGDREGLQRFANSRQWRAVVNCGAYTAVDRAETDADLAHSVNAHAPALLASVAAHQSIPIVHVSTDYVFDGTKDCPYVETDRVNPLSVYGATKAEGERGVRAEAPDHHAIVRTAWVLSAGGSNFLTTMLRLGETRDHVRIVSDQVGSPTHATDLAGVLLTIVEQDAATGETWHVVNEGATSWYGLAEHIFERTAAAGLSAPAVEAIGTAEYPTAARRPANSRLATDKLRTDLNIVLRPWRDAIDDILDQRLKSLEK